MPNSLQFYLTSNRSHSILEPLESYLDNNHKLIPHAVHDNLVSIFDDLNDDLANLIADYENKIKELEENHA